MCWDLVKTTAETKWQVRGAECTLAVIVRGWQREGRHSVGKNEEDDWQNERNGAENYRSWSQEKKWRDLSSALHLFPRSLFFKPPPLFSLALSFESPANSVSVCCMLPWLFLEPDALCYLPVRPTNSGCCVCVCERLCVCYCMCGWLFFVHMRETERGKKMIILNFFPLFSCSFLSQAPSSLLEALEQHLASLEGKKTKELNADTR